MDILILLGLFIALLLFIPGAWETVRAWLKVAYALFLIFTGLGRLW